MELDFVKAGDLGGEVQVAPVGCCYRREDPRGRAETKGTRQEGIIEHHVPGNGVHPPGVHGADNRGQIEQRLYRSDFPGKVYPGCVEDLTVVVLDVDDYGGVEPMVGQPIEDSFQEPGPAHDVGGEVHPAPTVDRGPRWS